MVEIQISASITSLYMLWHTYTSHDQKVSGLIL